MPPAGLPVRATERGFMRTTRWSAIVLAFLTLPAFHGVARAQLSIDGCPSVYPLVFKLSLAYMNKGGPETKVGSMLTDLAIKAVQEGTTNIGMSSRPLTDEEKATGMRELLLASEGLTLFVNKDNPVKELTKHEVSRIFRGEIQDWSDLSSADGATGPIVVIHHRPECGVSVTARMRFLGDMKAEMVKGEEVVTCHKVVSRVMDTLGGLGYGARSMTLGKPPIRVLKVDGVESDPEAIGSGKYPYSFELRLVHRLEPSKSAAMFLDFVKSDEGRRVIAEEGYILPEK